MSYLFGKVELNALIEVAYNTHFDILVYGCKHNTLNKRKENKMSIEPTYIQTLKDGDLSKKVEKARKHITNCT